MRLESAVSLKRELLAPQYEISFGWENVLGSGLRAGVSDSTPTASRLPRRSRAPAVALGVGVGSGPDNFRIAVRTQVRNAAAKIFVEDVRKRAKGEVDERHIGRLRRLTGVHTPGQARPLTIGASIGHFATTAGTLGCFVRPSNDPNGGPLFLSNNHILADENSASPGDAILQPGPADGGKLPTDKVGELSSFIPLDPAGPNSMDAAVAAVDDGVEVDDLLPRLGVRVSGLGPSPSTEGVVVRKIGRMTGLTLGRVTSFDLDNVRVSFDIGMVLFNGQIEIEGEEDLPFSRPGDSGALVFGPENEGLALLFAGSRVGGSNGMGLTYASPLESVLGALSVSLLA